MPMIQFEKYIENIQIDANLPKIPILIVSTDDNLSSAELMIRHGAHELIRYPFEPREIYIRLQVLIRYLKDHTAFIPPESAPESRGLKS